MRSLRNTPINEILLSTLMNPSARSGLKHRKYSLQLLDESIKLAAEIGPTNASRITGVPKRRICEHRRSRDIEANGAEGMRKAVIASSQKWSTESKRACVKLALAICKAHGPLYSVKKAYEEAGQRTGICGKTARNAFERGLLTLA